MSEVPVTIMMFCAAFLFVLATVCSAVLSGYIILCFLAPAIWRKIISKFTDRGN